MLTEIEEGGGEGGQRYAVQVVTEKGEGVLEGLGLEEIEETLPVPVVGSKTPVLEAGEWPRLFERADWARLADRCLSCRMCTYVCPT